MLLGRLLSLLTIAPLLTQARSIIQPRVDDSQQQDNEICLTYSTCSEKGLRYWNKLQTTLYQAQQGQIFDRDDSEVFKKYYYTAYDESSPVEPDLEQPLKNRGIDPATEMDTWRISGLNPSTGLRDKDAAYYNIFDTYNGFIIADSNRRAGDSQQRLPWSELMYQTCSLAEQKANQLALASPSEHHPGGPISNLRGVVQHFIVNKGTQQVLTAAYKANGWEAGYDQPDQWRVFREEDAGRKNFFFYGLLGTDNVKGTVWLLNDHANEIGRKDISAIYVRWSTGNPDI
ncbi:MAG: hypothetical protein Q9168_006066, partial [Polycauliona sp. 1 TL-2023]